MVLLRLEGALIKRSGGFLYRSYSYVMNGTAMLDCISSRSEVALRNAIVCEAELPLTSRHAQPRPLSRTARRALRHLLPETGRAVLISRGMVASQRGGCGRCGRLLRGCEKRRGSFQTASSANLERRGIAGTVPAKCAAHRSRQAGGDEAIRGRVAFGFLHDGTADSGQIPRAPRGILDAKTHANPS